MKQWGFNKAVEGEGDPPTGTHGNGIFVSTQKDRPHALLLAAPFLLRERRLCDIINMDICITGHGGKQNGGQ